jgi:uncharacterized membrane protein YvlD (DUF360 family)
MLGRIGRLYRAQWHALGSLSTSWRSIVFRVVLSIVSSAIAFGLATWLTPGVSAATDPSVLTAVVLLGIIDVLLRPLILAIALPIGLIAVALVGLLLRIVAFAIVLPAAGYETDSFLAIVIASFIYGAVQTILGGLIGMSDEDSFSARVVAQVIRDDVPQTRSDVPGVVIIQIDGLAAPLLRAQVRAGNLPTLSRWIRGGSHRMTEWTALLPSQTSASQAGLLLGSNDGIPAFRWYEKENRRLLVSNHPEDAREIERRLSTGNGLLADGGAGIDNLFSGDAPITRLTMSTVGQNTDQEGATRSLYYFLLNPYSLGRAIVRTLGEAVKEVFQARQQVQRGIEPRMHRGGTYPFLRAATNVVMRDLNLALVTEQMLRGTPSIYVDFLDYDEIAHHSGPERSEAIHSLEGIDRSLKRLQGLVASCPRPYEFVIVSDHGQSQGATFRQRYGQTIEEWLRQRMATSDHVTATEPTGEQLGQLSAVLTEVSAADGAVPRMARRAMRDQTRNGIVEVGPTGEDRTADAEGLPDLVVCASGNLALIYFGLGDGRLTAEEIDAGHPGLLDDLVAHDGVGLVLVTTEGDGSVVLGNGGRYRLSDGAVTGDDPLARYGPLSPVHFRRLDEIAHVGDLALISRIDDGTDEVAAFEELIGSHGGLGGWQTRASLVYPSAWPDPETPLLGAPAVHRQLKAWIAALGPARASTAADATTAMGEAGEARP